MLIDAAPRIRAKKIRLSSPLLVLAAPTTFSGTMSTSMRKGPLATSLCSTLSCAAGMYSCLDLLRRSEIETLAGRDQQSQRDSGQRCEQTGAEEPQQRPPAEAAETLHGAEPGDAEEERAEHDRHDDHEQQPQEQVAERLDPLVGDPLEAQERG